MRYNGDPINCVVTIAREVKVNHTMNNSRRNPCCHNGGDCPGGDFFRLTWTSLGSIFDGFRPFIMEMSSEGAIVANSKLLVVSDGQIVALSRRTLSLES